MDMLSPRLSRAQMALDCLALGQSAADPRVDCKRQRMGMTLYTDDGVEIRIERIRVVEVLAGELVLVSLAGSRLLAQARAVEDKIKILFREKKPLVSEDEPAPQAESGKG